MGSLHPRPAVYVWAVQKYSDFKGWAAKYAIDVLMLLLMFGPVVAA